MNGFSKYYIFSFTQHLIPTQLPLLSARGQADIFCTPTLHVVTGTQHCSWTPACKVTAVWQHALAGGNFVFQGNK